MNKLESVFTENHDGKNIEFIKNMEENEIRFQFGEYGSEIKKVQVIFTGFIGLAEGLKELVKRKVITEGEAEVYELAVITAMLRDDPELMEHAKQRSKLLYAFRSLSDSGKKNVLDFIHERFPDEEKKFREVLKA